MKRKAEDKLELQERRLEFRNRHKENKAKKAVDMRNWQELGIQPEIMHILEKPENIDMENFEGSIEELEWTIERLYANDGRDFDPETTYPPSMISNLGQDYMLNCRGIYYRDRFSTENVLADRKVWIPTLPPTKLKDTTENRTRLSRADFFAEKSRNNESWCKSEYAWEADAWSQVFGNMREDYSLAIDKRKYSDYRQKSDEISCKLTDKYELKERIPDAVFGMATFTDDHAELPCWAHDLDRTRLERVLLHPNYGLAADPKRDDSIGLAFPFMVYEAKGWRGDCREARRQACSAAAVYLDMLDQLARAPGQADTLKVYQTKTSHRYQVFALTSFGAYWHLLVGYRRPRSEEEHAGVPGMSDTVYMFQNIWSGAVTCEIKAFELLSLIDQIHLWAITEHRSFVLDHLKAWHDCCSKNLFLEWDSRYDRGDRKKRIRNISESGEIKLPNWVSYFSEPSQRSIHSRAIRSLMEAVSDDYDLLRTFNNDQAIFKCSLDDCSQQMVPRLPILVRHFRTVHDMDEKDLANVRSVHREKLKEHAIKERLESGVTVRGHKSFLLRAAREVAGSTESRTSDTASASA